jgi:hypothetical protein
MEPECSLPRSQVPATCPYPEPARSSPYPHFPLPELSCPISLPQVLPNSQSSSRFVTKPVFTVRSCQHLAQPPSWRTTPCRLSATAYSIYWQLPSILEAVPPSATWGRAMPWWQGIAYHGFTSDTQFLKHSLKTASTSVETRRSISQTAWFGVWNVTHWVLVWCKQHKHEHNSRYVQHEDVSLCQRTVPAVTGFIASQYVCVLVEPWAAKWFLFDWECSPYI